MQSPLFLIALLPAVHAACTPPPDVTWDTIVDPFTFSLSTSPKNYIGLRGGGGGDRNLVSTDASSAAQFTLRAGVPISGRKQMVISTQNNLGGLRRLFMTDRDQTKPEFVASLVCEGDNENWKVKFTPKAAGAGPCIKDGELWWKPAGVVSSSCVGVQFWRDNGLKEFHDGEL